MYDNEYYGAPNDYRNYLSHHGIKGQKWGVMHGPPYPLGSHTSAMIKKGKKVAAKAKKTYDKKIKPKVNDLAKKGSDFYDKNMPEKGKQAINKAAKKTKEVYEVNKEMVKKGISNYKSNYDSTKNDLKAKSVLSGTDSNKEDRSEINTKEFLPLDYKSFKHDDPKNRQNLAAILGLKAINKSGIRDKSDPSNKLDKEWFLYEDQTELLPEIADLINHGYTAKQVISSLDKTYNRIQQMSDKEYEGITDKEWVINDVWRPEVDTFKQYYPNATENALSWAEKNRKWMIDFAQACEDIYNEEHKK